MREVNFKSFGESDIGLGRINNEDVFAQMPTEKFFILADGMGGHKAGEVAANETVVHICNSIRKAHQMPHSEEEWKDILEKSVIAANAHVFALSETNQEMQGMGTTLCMALIANEILITAHVGDSRIYRVRKGRLTRMTKDHSMKNDLIDKGELDESLALSFPYKNVITRAIGTQKTVSPEVCATPIQKEDIYLLCSDGVSDPLSDAQIHDVIDMDDSPRAITENLILEAKKAGGNDNITAITIKIS